LTRRRAQVFPPNSPVPHSSQPHRDEWVNLRTRVPHPLQFHRKGWVIERSLTALLALLLGTLAPAQAPNQPPPTPGTVLFERTTPTDSAAPQAPTTPPTADSLRVTDAERSALTFTAYDLDLHLAPANAAISARAFLTVRNDSALPLPRLILQLSSSLQWDSIAARTTSASTPIPFATHQVPTDADHTGGMTEAVLTLAHPLPPGESLSVNTLYSGTIAPSAERLLQIGAPNDQALAADWDAIAPPDANGITGGTALRGFGNVLWYPVSAPPVFLGDGAKLFQAVGAAKLRQSSASIRLRLAVEYLGDPPDAAFFCGRRGQLTAISDNPNLPAAESPGVATTLFEAQPLGFRTPSLFLTASAPTVTGTPADSTLLAAITDHYDALPAWSAAAAQVEPLLTDWFGPQPLTPLTLLDHPGQPFEDDTLLVRPLRTVSDPATLAPALVHSLTHAWIHSNQAWIDEGLAQFATLLWTEHTAGRPAALAELQQDARTLALIEPETPANAPESSSSSSTQPAEELPDTTAPPASVHATTSPAGTSLVAATGEVFYRTKAAAVWWMLRSIVGDDALKQALQAYRLDPKLDRDPAGMQHTLERFSHKDLSWFFNDWVDRDRGLPDLSILSITPSKIDSTTGLPAGWLVAVAVRNDGYATADIPVTVRSGVSTQTQRLRIAGRSTGSTRVVFAGTPTEVEVNDGTVPETETSIHTRQFVLPSH
jgi:hypothetical protein